VQQRFEPAHAPRKLEHFERRRHIGLRRLAQGQIEVHGGGGVNHMSCAGAQFFALRGGNAAVRKGEIARQHLQALQQFRAQPVEAGRAPQAARKARLGRRGGRAHQRVDAGDAQCIGLL